MPTESQLVADDLARKIRLENTFRREIKTLFNRQNRDFRTVVASTGFPPEAIKSRGDWESILRRHYERVQAKFKGVVSPGRARKQNDDDNERERMALLALALLTWRDRMAPQQAESITQTTDKNYRNSMTQAQTLIREQGLDASNLTLAATAVVLLKRMFAGREEGIAVFETQQAAESTKLAEAEVLSGLQPSVLTGISPEIIKSKKKWKTVGDNLVRLWHVAANNQTRLVNLPFEVMGELLMHPGDTSLGASLKNVANCRCSSLYTIM